MILYCDQARLRTLLSEVCTSEWSSFYRTKYQNQVSEESSLSDVPYLERHELTAVNPFDRCYIPDTDVCFTAHTSGTSSGEPLVSLFGQVERYYVEPSWGMPVSRALVVFPPLNKNFGGTFIQQCREAERPIVPVFGDPANLPASAHLGAITHVDALYATPSLAFSLASHLKAAGIVTNIKLLVISGETITDAAYASLRVLYPQAAIVNAYASSEIGQFIMGPTPAMMRDRVYGFSLLTDAIIAAELIEDELVVTYGANPAFPLIRYKTGDLFTVREDWTRTYGQKVPILEWAGKGGVDLVRVHGIEIRSGSVDAFFATVPAAIESYQLHMLPGEGSAATSLRLEYVVPDQSSVDRDYIHEHFMTKFLLGKDRTVRQAVADGLVDEVHVVTVSALSWQGAKRRVLVNHIS